MEKQESKQRFPTFPQPRRLRTITTYGIRILRARSLNAFPTYIQFLGERPNERKVVEMPRSDLTYGIRPVLYFMLRIDFASASCLRNALGTGTEAHRRL